MNSQAAAALAERRPFASGALRGSSQPNSPGRLLGPDRELYYADAASMTFIVYSYATPIYWETPDHMHLVTARFSQTTTRHQSAVRAALSSTTH